MPLALKVPGGSSTSVRARGTHLVNRPGVNSDTARTTLPFLSTNRTSMVKRMPNVWTCLHRGNMRASPSSMESRPRRPLVLSRCEIAKHAREAMTVLRVSLMMDAEVLYLRSLMTQQGEPTEMVWPGMSWVTTDPAPITAPSPMVTPLVTTTPAPSQQSFPMTTGP